jgi:hypothetical protein
MMHRRKVGSSTVKQQGAAAGSVVRGVGTSNSGLRLCVLEEQPPGVDGPIRGNFVILDVGDNKHSSSLQPLLGRPTNAQEVLAIIRREYTACVNVANTNSLAPEQHVAASRAALEEQRDDRRQPAGRP